MRGAAWVGLLWLLVCAPLSVHAQSPADFDGDGDANAADNCRYAANATQLDSSLPADGIGDACTCGDADGNGRIDLRDAVRLRRALAQLAPALADPAKCSVIGGSMDCDVGDATRLRQSLAGSAALGNVCRAFVGAGVLPTRMAVAGDSITRGFAASCECNVGFGCLGSCALGGTEQPQYSWFDGTSSEVFSLADRYRVFASSITATSSAAESGARMRGGSDSFEIQAARLIAQSPIADFVTVLLGGNDLCSRECVSPSACSNPLFSDAEWREAIDLGLDLLAADLPLGATVYLSSVPRVHDLYAAGIEKQDDESDVDCELVWEAFDICRIVTDDGTVDGETHAFRLAQVAARQRRYNEILVEQAVAWTSNANGQNPRGIRVVSDYAGEIAPSVGTFVFGPDEINGGDCFHPSLAGQNAIAEQLWQTSPVR